jgi:3-hydroxyisobutyrate dehydrogenase-like beta-hydroxyacid dehydrogenase
MDTAGFVGLGAMGSRMAMNLHAAGFRLRVWNRDPAKAKPFADKGIAVAASSAEAARGAQFVVSMVADDVATREIMLGAAGVVGAAGSRLLKTRLPRMLARDFAPQFQLDLLDKDLRYFLSLAQELDRPAPIASLVRSQTQAARRAGLGKLDTGALFLQAAGEKPRP